ncbi:MAG: malate dehydrogenase [Succinatimonas sp.]|nr:malate dehydrogenase [Succinatimonas sp.]MCI7025056.1 malate dehydrogenase [Succinatimonas sp.]MDD6756285.1 malate dehydrogenase [Succinatimonas sp.]MDY6246661.1 malic enzyme-like NAD(P)-binding protein [Succinivibrio sp.]MDY6262084.1 malic enzyme-like NAD(P)-binding protein [Succinivibrio sp.]
MSHDAKLLHDRALAYHENPVPGKIKIEITKPAETADDLTLAYSPGVAEPVREIAKDPENAYRYTGKGNSVAIISNGTAILGLGNLGPLASKPVMEGKALLFKRFADINAIDIEVDNKSVEDFITTVECIANTFGGVNLEDIKAPECFEIERELIKRCKVPIFHDDQHGTAIVTTAGILNAVELQGKKIEDCKVVCVGAGAAGIACSDFLIKCGAKKENFFMVDRHGVIRSDRPQYNNGEKPRFINDAGPKTLKEAMENADVLLGVSGPGLIDDQEVIHMAKNAVIFACSNPDPEVDPEVVSKLRPDIIMGTGRSDYPNQINNVLCFPYLFRGALDVRATCINTEMMKAAMNALRNLAKEPVPAEVVKAAQVDHLEYGRDYLIPKPMDARLKEKLSSAVARAAVDSGVAQIPLPDCYK